MLTAIEIENFKAIGQPIRIELRPLTLLFGPNSAGKSSILQALQYAEEILDRRNLDPDRTQRGGTSVDLGGFRELVHNHDLESAVRLRLDFTVGSADLPAFADPWELGLAVFNEGLASEIETAWVEWKVAWSRQFQMPILAEYSVGANGSRIGWLRSRGDVTVWLEDVDLAHPLLHYDGRQGDSKQAELPLVPEGPFKALACVAGLWALPDWSVPLTFPDGSVGSDPSDEEPAFGRLTAREFYLRISTLFVGLGSLLRDELRRQRHVGPLRELPARAHESPKRYDSGRWASGLAAWDALGWPDGSALLGKLNHWLQRLGAGYTVRITQFKAVPLISRLGVILTSDEAPLDHVETLPGEFAALETRRQVTLVDEARHLEVRVADVGVGVSQLLPVLLAVEEVRGDRPRLVAIEQPELHVHPAIQVELGDFFAAEAIEGRVILLETHSEHLMLRLKRRVDETASGDLPIGAPGLTREQLSVVYIEPVDGEVQAHQLRLDDAGRFVDRWPHGFFEERAKELF